MAERPKKRQRLTYPLVIEDEACCSGKRTVRSRSEHLAVEQGKIVECANTLSLQDFVEAYFPHDLKSGIGSWDDGGTGKLVGLFTNPAEDAANTLKHNEKRDSVILACLWLVAETSKNHYENSEIGWSEAKKRKEMELPDLKYFVMRREPNCDTEGFVSFMVTYEDGHEVLYIYEVHIIPNCQRRGLGRKLLGVAEQVGRKVGLEKVMLTVFRSNTKAVGWYKRLGYSIDDYSPEPKLLRNGTVKESSHLILSKSLKDKKCNAT